MSDASNVMPCPSCGSSGTLNLEMSRVECFDRCGVSFPVMLPMSIPAGVDAWNAGCVLWEKTDDDA